jgi:aryl-alcohol dehydrogenase-like predicted oxidoreductase
VVGEGQVTYANDDEILESLAEQLLHGQDCNHETDPEDEHEVHSAESGMVSSDADADLQRLLEQAAAVCKVHPSTPTSFALHYVHVQIFRDSVLRGFMCA